MTTPAYPIEDARLPMVEDALTAFGLKYTLTEISLDRVDIKASLANQVRLTDDVVDTDRVALYSQLMKTGAKFPAVVAANGQDNKKVVVYDGNHRTLAGREAKLDTIYGYLIEEVDGSQELLLRAYANSYIGVGQTRREKIAHGIGLLQNGVPLGIVADVVQLPAHALSAEMKILEGSARARKFGIFSLYSKLNRTTRTRLSSVTNDKVFRRAVEFFVAHYVNTAHLKAMVVKANQARTEADALALFDAEERAMKTSVRSPSDLAGLTEPDRAAGRFSYVLTNLLTTDLAVLEPWVLNRASAQTITDWTEKLTFVHNLVSEVETMIEVRNG